MLASRATKISAKENKFLFLLYVPLRPTLFQMFAADIRLQHSDSGQVQDRHAVLRQSYSIDIAHTEGYVFWRIVADFLYRHRKRRVARFERQEYARVRRDCARTISSRALGGVRPAHA